MKIYINSIKDNQAISLDNVEQLNKLNCYFSIKSFNSIKGIATLNLVDNIIKLNIKANLALTLVSSYSLKNFNDNIEIDEELFFTDNQEFENDDIFNLDKNYIDLDEIIYSLTVTSIPVDVHQEGEDISSLDGYKIYQEDEIENTSPFDCLKDIDDD